MIMLNFLMATSFGSPTMPTPPEMLSPYPSECVKAIELRVGVEVPPILKMNNQGGFSPVCNGVLVPTSQLHFLIKRDVYAEELQHHYLIRASELNAEIVSLQDAVNEHFVWYKKPTAQRWFGRAEALFLVGAAFVVANQVNKLSNK